MVQIKSRSMVSTLKWEFAQEERLTLLRPLIQKKSSMDLIHLKVYLRLGLEKIFIFQKALLLLNKMILYLLFTQCQVGQGNVRGYFANIKETVLNDKPIAFLHIDCDIYSSTKEVFEILGDRIVSGTIIVFDEFYNYPGSENHEFKAFHEFLQKSGKKARYIAFNQYFEQAAVRIE